MPQGRSGWTDAAPVRRRSGFTLIELIVTLAVAGILLSIGVPGFSHALLNSRRTASINELIGTLTYARSEAISTHRTISVCRSASVGADDSRCMPGSGWENGWLTFVDENGDGRRDPEDRILRTHPALNAGSTLRGNTKLAEKIRFNGHGVTVDNGRLIYCDRRGWSNDARIVVLATSGKVRTTAPDDDSNPSLSSCLR